MQKDDVIYRQAAIDALWKALYEYEDKTEKQFQESDELDIGDWTIHRIFVQNMSDIDMQTIRNLPSAEPERKNEPAGCNGCRYDWFGDPRCAKCSRSFQDHYEAERKEE
jgi:hypothetical protein